VKPLANRILQRATVIVTVAFVVISCKNKIKTASIMDISDAPVQTVLDMFVVQTDKGKMQMRVESPVMERYHKDSLDYEIFPEGFNVYAYNEEGELETKITANFARHDKPATGNEIWAAYGDVFINNIINRETMETDTLYWDPDAQKIFTDCYVRLVSPSGFMQGYGMESDQRARNSVIIRPFNSYGLVENDSTAIVIDSVNFIGPFQKK